MNRKKLDDLYGAINEIENLKSNVGGINGFEESENYWIKLKGLQKTMKEYINDLLDL